MLTYDVEINYYAILEIEYTATSSQIKKNYHQLALKQHPDKRGDPEKFKELANAYEILMDEETRRLYDFERRHYSTKASLNDTTEHHVSTGPSEPNPVSPAPENSVIFNTINSTAVSSSTSLVSSRGIKNMASEGLKADEMSNDELYHLARASEPVALAVAKNIGLLMRLHSGFLNYYIWNLAEKHPSFAYQILVCKETREYFYAGIRSHTLTTLLKNDYHLLLLVVGSTELTEKLLCEDGKTVLNGMQLHEIYNFHVTNSGNCNAFMTLLESNSQFNVLFHNQEILQSENAEYELQQLALLDTRELSILAKKKSLVAAMIIKHETLLKMFNRGGNQEYVVDILLAHPDALMDEFFNHPRSFYFDEWAKSGVLSACKKNIKFLIHILNSQESNWLNGYDIAHLIENNSETQPHIYQFETFKNRHEAYKTLVEQITTRLVLDVEPFSAKVKSIYQPIFDNMGEFREYELLHVIRYLAKSYDHQILGANCVLIRDSYGWCNASNLFAEISSEFFCVTYNHESLRNSLYLYSDTLCKMYFVAFERLLQDPRGLSHISDEALFELQQKWVCVEANKVKNIFNQNALLMQRWHKGHRMNKLLHQSVLVSDYQKNQSLHNEPESIIQIRSLMSELQDKLAFDRIIFEGNKAFVTHLAEQASLLATTSSLNTIDERILPGFFWFIVLTYNPHLLNDDSPLDFIRKQMEIAIDDLKSSKTIEESWLIKCHKNNNGETIYELHSAYEQEKRWLNMVSTGSLTETVNALKRAVESVKCPFVNEEEDKTKDALNVSIGRPYFTLGCYCSSIGVCLASIAYGLYQNRPILNHPEDILEIGVLAFGGALSITGGLLVAMSLFSRQEKSSPNNQPQSNEQPLSYK
jgi:hypothetical protein